MYSEFAYSSQMQFILAGTSFVSTFFSLYLVAELILTFYGECARKSQKALFAFVTGTLLHNVWVYSIYFIGGMVSFDPIVYPLVISPNPIMALLYYYAALKIFKLSPARSIKMMGYVYLYWVFNTTGYQLLGAVIYVQKGPTYNYLLDALQVVTMFILFFTGTKLLMGYIRKNHAKLMFVEDGLFYRRKEFTSFFFRALFVYILTVATPIFVPSPAVSSIIINVFLLMFIMLNMYIDLRSYNRQIISNQEVHISALFKGLEEFRGIKHDFYNILHTYSGYLELGEYDKLKVYHSSLVETTSHAGTMLDLARRTSENPAFVSLLMDKLAYAEKSSVKLMISLKCDLEDFYVNAVDVSRVLACLLDNAIEAAAESVEKQIYFTCETKGAGSKLIIITNTTKTPVEVNKVQKYGVTTKPGHSGIGLNTVRNTLTKYGNCTFRIQYFNHEFSAYMEFRKR